MSVNLLLIGVIRLFHAGDCVSLEHVPFVEQLGDALRIGAFAAGQTLQISRLFARTRP